MQYVCMYAASMTSVTLVDCHHIIIIIVIVWLVLEWTLPFPRATSVQKPDRGKHFSCDHVVQQKLELIQHRTG